MWVKARTVRNQRKSLLAQHSAIASRDATKPSPKVKILPTPRSDARRRDRQCVSEVRRAISVSIHVVVLNGWKFSENQSLLVQTTFAGSNHKNRSIDHPYFFPVAKPLPLVIKNDGQPIRSTQGRCDTDVLLETGEADRWGQRI